MKSIDYNGLASAYALHRRIHPLVLRELVSIGRIRERSKVLEVGCGTGNYILELSSLTGCPSWGVDPSEQMLSKARKRPGTVDFRVGHAENLQFLNGFFDLVFSVDVIHHLTSREGFFQEGFRVLKTGGKICTVTDSEWIIRHREPQSVYFPETVEVELMRYPSIRELRETMRRTGFQAIGEEMVEFPYQLKDVEAYRDRVFSSLHLISQADFRRGLDRMEKELVKGPIKCVSRYLLLWGTKTRRLAQVRIRTKSEV